MCRVLHLVVCQRHRKKKKKSSKFDYSIFFVSEQIINNSITPQISKTKWCSWTETSIAFDILADKHVDLTWLRNAKSHLGEGLFDLQTVTPLLHRSHWLMVAGNSAVMPGQLAAWHSLYLAHPAEQFMSTHKQDLVIYDCPPNVFLFSPFQRRVCGLAGIKQTVAGELVMEHKACVICVCSLSQLWPREGKH